jgi:putative two-component system response regulator
MFKAQYENNPRDFQEFIIRMAYLSEIKEWDNRPHIERIRRICYILASGLNLPLQEIEIIAIASQLHDTGKINIPEELVKKTGRYDTFEWGIIEKHTVDGAKILSGSSSPVLQTAEEIALSHHEKWDGTGYPRGLRGQEAPLVGRICALADIFDALTTPRSYKQPMSYNEALKLITESRGKLFDPELVDIFIKKSEDIERSVSSVK